MPRILRVVQGRQAGQAIVVDNLAFTLTGLADDQAIEALLAGSD